MLREYRFFLAAFGIFWLGGLVLWFVVPHGDEVLFFSTYRGIFADTFFRVATLFGEGYPFILIGAVLWWYRGKFPWDISFLGVCISVVSFLTKTWFAHDRPYAYFHKLEKLDLLVPVEGVVMHSGATSFPSGHTMAAFGLFTFLALLAPSRKVLSLLWLFLAAMVGISRIYLGQHFLEDVLAGALLGTLLALMIHFAFRK
jgi:membrane-associated phospholipid phosphatase